MDDDDDYTLEMQIACVRRELALRQRVYPKWVASGRMKATVAEHEIGCMQAIHDRLAVMQPAEAGKVRSSGVWLAIDSAGGVRALARLLQITPGNISRWLDIPVNHVLRIEKELSIPREILRPDIYPPKD